MINLTFSVNSQPILMKFCKARLFHVFHLYLDLAYNLQVMQVVGLGLQLV